LELDDQAGNETSFFKDVMFWFNSNCIIVYENASPSLQREAQKEKDEEEKHLPIAFPHSRVRKSDAQNTTLSSSLSAYSLGLPAAATSWPSALFTP
jgi:hypothetical protein